MDATNSVKLRQRKNQIEITLRYLDNERRDVEDNTDWLNQAARASRVTLLDQLTSWYREELQQVDGVLFEFENDRGRNLSSSDGGKLGQPISNSSILR
jgi:hypothetical protein